MAQMSFPVPLSNVTVLEKGFLEILINDGTCFYFHVKDIQTVTEYDGYCIVNHGEEKSLIYLDATVTEIRLLIRKACGWSDEDLGLEALKVV